MRPNTNGPPQYGKRLPGGRALAGAVLQDHHGLAKTFLGVHSTPPIANIIWLPEALHTLGYVVDLPTL